MLVATLTQIPIRTRIQMYSLSVNEENFAVAFLLLFVSFSSSFSLYDALFFLPCSHHCVVLSEKEIQQMQKAKKKKALIWKAHYSAQRIGSCPLAKQGYR